MPNAWVKHVDKKRKRYVQNGYLITPSTIVLLNISQFTTFIRFLLADFPQLIGFYSQHVWRCSALFTKHFSSFSPTLIKATNLNKGINI